MNVDCFNLSFVLFDIFTWVRFKVFWGCLRRYLVSHRPSPLLIYLTFAISRSSISPTNFIVIQDLRHCYRLKSSTATLIIGSHILSLPIQPRFNLIRILFVNQVHSLYHKVSCFRQSYTLVDGLIWLVRQPRAAITTEMLVVLLAEAASAASVDDVGTLDRVPSRPDK